ncbi:MAG: AAA family ATPase [Thiomargarita sp.]|nr:AAA family ATPase [Thiomargarita sp.]
MLTLVDYTVTTKIYESAETIVYRGYRTQDNQPVIIKGLQKDSLDPKKIAQFHHEYDITKDLNLQSIVKSYALLKHQNSVVLIFEDIKGDSLREVIQKQHIDLTTFLHIAIKLAKCLGELHANNIIHKDIKPANIIINLQTRQVKLTDFSIASRITSETQTKTPQNLLEGTLQYMSPEQTGRMNRVIDYRTDFYSLGCVFYEMLVGHPPFESTDRLELVHCHIAKRPTAPYIINDDIPKVISDITLKLLEKTTEARYQSTFSLKTDLLSCQQQLQHTGKIEDFICGKEEISENFQIPSKLYGRESELDNYLTVFDRVSEGSTEMMKIVGYSGVGKSTLVPEIYKSLTKKRGYLISGKFEQFQRNIPYSAIMSAFGDLVQQLLTESETQLEYWRKRLLTAFGQNGQIIIDVIPEIEMIVGKQPEVQTLSSLESENRFHLVFKRFIWVFCRPKHPLVIFLDDLQWADLASLKLIEIIMIDEYTRYLFLMGAYGETEVTSTHPVMLTFNELRKHGIVINQITLVPLNIDHVTQLIADTLHSASKTILPLAELVMQKTQGNPLFVNQFLKILYQERLLTFDIQNSGWHWDMQKLKALDITDNVVDLMLGKFKKLPENTQKVLQLAACVGNHFDLYTLSIISDNSLVETYEYLLPALQESLIIATSESKDTDSDTLVAHFLLYNKYKFLHDRMQQAAYTLIDERHKQSVHLKIGKRLRKQLSSNSDTFQEQLFKVVEHLNIGRALIESTDEQIQLVHLNLEAGKKAKNAMAYAAAKEYLTFALELLQHSSFQDKIWTECYELTFELHEVLATIEYLNGNFTHSEELINQTLTHANTAFEKAELYNLLIVQKTLKAKYAEAIQIGIQALALLGIDWPAHHLQKALDIEFSKAKENLGHQDIASLVDKSEMTLPEHKLAMRLLSNMHPLAYIVNKDLFNLIVLKSVNLSLKNGHVAESAASYSCYGILLGAISGEYQAGYQFGRMALKLTEKFNNLSQKSKAYYYFSNFVSSWVKHINRTRVLNNEAFEAALASGLIPFAGYINIRQFFNSFFQGEVLDEILSESVSSLSFSQKTGNQYAIDSLQGGQLCLLNLTGKTANKLTFDIEDLTEADYLARCEKNSSFFSICRYHIVKSQILYFYEKYPDALKSAIMAEKQLDFVIGTVSVAEHNFFYSLSIAALFSEEEKEQQLLQLEQNQKQMKIWADNCPDNFLHKYLLIEAEKARILGQDLEAMDFYDQAIKSACENDFIQNRGLANELAAKFWVARDKKEIARLYMTKAHYDYQLWGAQRKVQDLEEKYPDLISKTKTPIHSRNNDSCLTSDTQSSMMTLSTENSLDLSTVMKASQAISCEIVPEQLIKKFMHIVIENAGAQEGWLILKKTAKHSNELAVFSIEAYGTVEKVQVLNSVPLDAVEIDKDTPDLCKAIVIYTARTQKPLVLNNASEMELFANDPYILKHRSQSILCFPIIYKNQLIGLFYLENDLTTNAFTYDRVDVLKMLSTQIAISLENAQTLATLDATVFKRTSQLHAKIEELEQTRQVLVQNENMASLGRLVAGFAHEINTPIGVAVGSASTLQENTQIIHKLLQQDEVEEEDLVSVLETIEEAASLTLSNLRRASALVGSFKRTAVDQTSDEVMKFGMKSLISDVSNSLHNKFKQTSIDIQVECSDTLNIYSIPGTLEQLLTNFMMNSLIHGFEKGTQAGSIKIVVELKEEKYLHLEYSDTGKGIAPSNLSKIFEPFFTTKRGDGGSGLGLYICYNLVKSKLEGTITCESSVGNGVLFKIDFPVAQSLPIKA